MVYQIQNHMNSMNTYAYAYDDNTHAIHFFSPMTVATKNDLSEIPCGGIGPGINLCTWAKSLQTDCNNVATRHRPCNQETLNTPAWKYIMSDNRKQEKDYTKEVDALLPQAETLIKVYNFVFITFRSFIPVFSQVNYKRDWIKSSR